MLAGPVDKIPDHEEVVVEARHADDGELVAGAQDEQLVGLEAGVVGRGGFLALGQVDEFGEALGDDRAGGDGGVVVAVARIQTFDTEVEQVGGGGGFVLGVGGKHLGRKRVARVALGALGKGDFYVAHFGDEAGVGQRLGDLAE